MAVAVVAIPSLIRVLGVPRFGVLSLAWTVIGYFSLFDLGMGRALTKLVADKLGAQQEHAIPGLAWTSLECEVTGTLDRVDRTARFVAFEIGARLRLCDE